jgi:hypothetical protein
VELTIPTAQKGYYITVANIYGISGASQGGDKFNANEKILAAAGRRASTFKNHPYFLMGDCNDDLKHSKVLTALVDQHVLSDIAAEFTKPGQPLQKTFSRDGIKPGMAGPGKTRIEFPFSNDVGIRVVDSFEYLFEETQGYDHLPRKLTLNIKAFTQKMNILTKSSPINLAAYDPKIHTSEVKRLIWESVWEDKRESYMEAVALEKVDAVHNIWCAALEDFVHTLLPIEETQHKFSKRTRGYLQAMKEVALTNKYDSRFQTLSMFLEKSWARSSIRQDKTPHFPGVGKSRTMKIPTIMSSGKAMRKAKNCGVTSHLMPCKNYTQQIHVQTVRAAMISGATYQTMSNCNRQTRYLRQKPLLTQTIQ